MADSGIIGQLSPGGGSSPPPRLKKDASTHPVSVDAPSPPPLPPKKKSNPYFDFLLFLPIFILVFIGGFVSHNPFLLYAFSLLSVSYLVCYPQHYFVLVGYHIYLLFYSLKNIFPYTTLLLCAASVQALYHLIQFFIFSSRKSRLNLWI